MKIKKSVKKLLPIEFEEELEPIKINSSNSSTQKKYANLREVMDYTVPFSLIYSGVENESYFDILRECGISNFLVSYHYVQKKRLDLRQRFSGLDIRMMIDSGAFTYQTDPEFSNFSINYWEDLIRGYLAWAEKNREFIFAIANMDIELLVGGAVVDRWNKEFFEPFMLRTGIPVCFVWHPDTYQTWEYYCQRYPFVGFSAMHGESSLDLTQYCREKVKTAEKYESLVHGFALTRTGLLTEVPFYTSDSTTWLAGLKYGEMNYWRKTNKMSRLKKDVWKTPEYLGDICRRYNLDEKKMLNEDFEEMIKANVYAFNDAEVFIKTRLKGMMYWLKAKTIIVDLNNLPPDFFPSPDWIDSTYRAPIAEVISYAKKMNINPECPEAKDLVSHATVFLNWDNPDYSGYRSSYEDSANKELINFLHDTYINRIVEDDRLKILDLINFFTENVSGASDRLLLLGTNFDRVVQERETYIEEDDEEFVDISREEVQKRLVDVLNLSPQEEAPEIDSLDEEIFSKANIVPVFDEKGLFVKGQKSVLKPKKVYSKKYPKFACDTCASANRCAEYKAGHVCAFQKMLTRFDTRNVFDVIQGMQGIVEQNMVRMQKAMIEETMMGVISDTTSQLMETNMRYLQNLHKLYEYGSPEVMSQTRITRADGSVIETTSVKNPQSGGILEKLFANVGNAKISDKEEKEPEKTKIYDVTEDE
jgi:hypothetical protein